MNTLDKIHEIRTYLTDQFKERDDVVDGLLTALVAKVHILLIGPPGTAKSAITVALAGLIDGFDYFQWLLTKFSTPEELFGPYDIAKLKLGQYERITAGKLPCAHLAYLDELFKANSAILNALLTLSNERVFYNGTTQEKAPLWTLVGTSNEYAQEAELQAVFDRFLLRYEPGYLKEDTHFLSMLLDDRKPQPTSLTRMELEVLQEAVPRVKRDSSVAEALMTLKSDLAQEGVFLSDRRWVQVARQLLPARAVLAGRDTIVLEEDADILQHALWEDPAQKSMVTSLVRKRLDPIAGQVTELLEDARDIASNAMKAPDEQTVAIATEAIKKLKAIRKDMQRFIATGGSPAKVERMKDADKTIEDLSREVMTRCLLGA